MRYPPDPTNAENEHSKVSSMAIVGHTTSNSCKLWVRMYRPGTWWLVVSDRPFMGNLDTLDGKQVDMFFEVQQTPLRYCKPFTLSDKTDNTHTFFVNDLPENKTYYYAVIADIEHKDVVPRRTEIGNQVRQCFSTFPSQPQNFVFGFYSCHDPFSTANHGEGAWPVFRDALDDRNAIFCIGGGDQVYVDTNDKDDMYSLWDWLATYKNQIIEEYSDDGGLKEHELTEYFVKLYRNYYRIYWNYFNLRKIYSRYPQYMIWDDHEIMDGWGSYTKDERKKLLNKLLQIDNEATNDRLIKLMYSAAKRVYLEYQHSHNPDTNIFLNEEDNPKCEWDYGFKVGEAAFYVLDMRGHHDYERDKKGNALLGDLQMKRFFAWLKSDPVRSASTVFIVSPVPVIHWNKFVMNFDVGPMKDDLRDEWDHKSNVKERKKLLDAVMGFSKKNKCPITFLSGDVHSASVYQIENDDRYRGAKVFSVTSSAISRKPAPSKAELLIKKSGGIKNYTGGTAHRLYALAGQNNFLMVSVDFTQDEASVSVDLCWPSGDDRELTRKRIKLS